MKQGSIVMITEGDHEGKAATVVSSNDIESVVKIFRSEETITIEDTKLKHKVIHFVMDHTLMARKPVRGLNPEEVRIFQDDEIEDSNKISQVQLNNARLYSSREEYAKSLPEGIRYLEFGVAWGYSAQLFIDTAKASHAVLVDLYNQDLKCWSWRKFGSCQCEGFKHELLYTPENHQQYIIDKFSYHTNTITVKGDATEVARRLNGKYDFIYIDINNDRFQTRDLLKECARLVRVGGIIGLNDYLIYDGVIEDQPYGTFQTTNEFLDLNKNWEVDAIALHNLGFYDIYIKRVS
jgi:hypothetical protein